MFRKILTGAVLIFLLIFFPFAKQIKAADNEKVEPPKLEQVNPDKSLEYGFKRLLEKIELFFQITPERKANYYKKLLQRRLSELVYVAQRKDVGNIEKTSQRFETTAGQLTELVLSENLDSEKKTISELFLDDSKILETAKNNFDSNSAEWRFVQNDINSLKIYLEKLNN